MVKKFISTAFAMIAISSAANASVLFSADNTLGEYESGCYPDWFVGTLTNDNDMALKTLDEHKENDSWMPIEQAHDNDMA